MSKEQLEQVEALVSVLPSKEKKTYEEQTCQKNTLK